MGGPLKDGWRQPLATRGCTEQVPPPATLGRCPAVPPAPAGCRSPGAGQRWCRSEFIKTRFAVFKFKRREENRKRCPWGFHSPPRSSAFKFCRTSINNASGWPALEEHQRFPHPARSQPSPRRAARTRSQRCSLDPTVPTAPGAGSACAQCRGSLLGDRAHQGPGLLPVSGSRVLSPRVSAQGPRM